MRIDASAVEALEPSLAIDADNLSNVMRVRSHRAVKDLATLSFWMKLFVAHLARSPYSRGFCTIQKWKDGAKGAGYAGKLTILLNDLVVAWETLLSDEALGDPDIWGRLFSLADGSDLVVKMQFDTTWARAIIGVK